MAKRRKVGWPKGRKKSAAHKKAISAGMRRYWAGKGKSRRRTKTRIARTKSGKKFRTGKATWTRKRANKKRGRGRPKGSKNKTQYVKHPSGSWMA